MKNNKRNRKVKSANKAVKRALKIERALHNANMACLVAIFTSQIAFITATKMKKEGCPREEWIGKIKEGVDILENHVRINIPLKMVKPEMIEELKNKLKEMKNA